MRMALPRGMQLLGPALLLGLVLSGCARLAPPVAADSKDLVTASDESDASKRARVRMELAAAYFGRGQMTTALDQTIAFDSTAALAPGARLLESSVVYYADSTQVYFDTWRRLATKSTGLSTRGCANGLTWTSLHYRCCRESGGSRSIWIGPAGRPSRHPASSPGSSMCSPRCGVPVPRTS